MKLVFKMLLKASLPSSNIPVKDDFLTKLVGHFGRWQFIIFSSVFLVKLASGWVQMAILFLTPKLTFKCVEFGNGEVKVAINSTCYQDCIKYEYDTNPFQNTIISEWDLVCERRWLASFTQTVLQFGILLGSVLFGFLSDRYGRRSTFLGAIVILVAFGFGIPFSPNYAIFTAQRFFLGGAAAGTMVISFVIVMETVGPKYRELLGCLFHIPFILGHLSIPLFAYYFRTWNTYTLALATPTLIYIGYFFIISESPRWLMSVGRVEDAKKIVRRVAEMNNLPTEKIDETLNKISSEISQVSQTKANFSDLFRPSLRGRTICMSAIWLISGLTFFGFNQYISQTSPDIFISVAAAAAIQIPSNIIAIFLMKLYGRKSTIAVFSCLSGIFVLILGCVPAKFWLTLTLGTLGVSCTAIVMPAIYIYSSELYPTVVRNMGIGVFSMSMRVGSMIAPFISNLSVVAIWLPTIIIGLAPILAGALCLWLPETFGSTLTDTIDVKNEE